MTPRSDGANRQVIYEHRPQGALSADDFRLVEVPIEAPGSGELLCRTILLSIDPANRAWMQARTYRDQLTEGDVMAGFTLCEVVDGGDTEVPAGSIVACEAG
jgi:NADPH-dependent curcumin reductase CurA